LFDCNMVLISSPDGTDVYGSRAGTFEEIGSVWGVKSCKIAFLGGISNLLVHRQYFAVGCISASETGGQSEDNVMIMPGTDLKRQKTVS